MTTTTKQQNEDFLNVLLEHPSGNTLETILRDLIGSEFDWVLGWVARKFKPEEVFSEFDLNEWALEHGFVLKSDGEDNADTQA